MESSHDIDSSSGGNGKGAAREYLHPPPLAPPPPFLFAVYTSPLPSLHVYFLSSYFSIVQNYPSDISPFSPHTLFISRRNHVAASCTSGRCHGNGTDVTTKEEVSGGHARPLCGVEMATSCIYWSYDGDDWVYLVEMDLPQHLPTYRKPRQFAATTNATNLLLVFPHLPLFVLHRFGH